LLPIRLVDQVVHHWGIEVFWRFEFVKHLKFRLEYGNVDLYPTERGQLDGFFEDSSFPFTGGDSPTWATFDVAWSGDFFKAAHIVRFCGCFVFNLIIIINF
jgi:hypothetical protein